MNVAELLRELSALHFLRPAWFYALMALPMLAWWWRVQRRKHNAWRGVVDPHLLPQLLETSGDRRSRFTFWFAALAYALAVLALAGPSWRQSAQPLWQSRKPLVIALDLSSATMAADLPPSRLAQARAKLATLLRERRGGQVGLVAFAGDAFTVAPLTDDAANVALFLDALQPDVMPVDGQRVDRAVAWSVQLLKRADAAGGDIVLLPDPAAGAAVAAAAKAANAGFRVSVLGLGNESGAAYHRPGGAIAHARLNAASLRKLVTSGGGRYATLTNDAADLRALQLLAPRDADATGKGTGSRVWQDEGYWLLPPLMLLAMFAFRRRAGTLAVLLVCIVLPAQPALAVDLWKRPDQAAHAQLQRGNTAYRKGDYTGAARQYEDLDSAAAHYNRGNALAKAGRYPQAIAAYDEALRRQPRMEDALANKRAVEAAMKRQPPSGSKPDQQQPQSSQNDQANPQQGPGQQQSPAKPSSQSPPQQPSQQAQQQNRQQQPSQSSSPPQSSPPPATPSDEKAQQEADQAQRESMQRALQQAGKQTGAAQPQVKARVDETAEQRERRLANEAWLKRVPDDPGGLLRAKFKLEYERRMLQGRPEE
jgi:Ca-activated chloride channel homolog